jgi:hypothetical protein
MRAGGLRWRFAKGRTVCAVSSARAERSKMSKTSHGRPRLLSGLPVRTTMRLRKNVTFRIKSPSIQIGGGRVAREFLRI